MPTLAEITDPLLWTYAPVPRVGPGVCEICHATPGEGFDRCYSCYETVRRVSRPVDLVLPVSLYVVGGQLHHVLRRYKDSPLSSVRDTFRTQVAALLGRFLLGHSNCIKQTAGRGWEFIAAVPSSGERAGIHPLINAINMLPTLRKVLSTPLARGPVALGHTISSDQGFQVTEPVNGRSFLLIDDTFTTGARLQSAASALQLSGGDVVGAVVLGRVINPDFSGDLWQRASKTPFSFDKCCLEENSSR